MPQVDFCALFTNNIHASVSALSAEGTYLKGKNLKGETGMKMSSFQGMFSVYKRH